MRRIRATILLSTLAMMLSVAVPAQGQVFKEIAIGLAEAGFNFQGDRNFLSGGADLTVSRTFNNETLDFGATELTLQGTPRFQLSTGGRGLEVLDISLNTAGNPLNYTLVTDTGSQLTTINGSFLLDATASINSFGFYDLDLNVSSRQTINQDGRFGVELTDEDFDIGPIDLRGNIFADLLASATDPIFDAMGVDNIFAQFSGAAQFEAKVSAQADRARAKAAAGQPLTSKEIAQLASISAMGAAMGLQVPDLSFIDDAVIEQSFEDDGAAPRSANAIPEPATLMLLALSGLALGDGGLLVTNDEKLAESARLLRTHGTLQRDVHDRLGYNSRLDEMQAAILRVKLPHVDEWNEGRRRVAARYDQELGDLTGIAIPSVAPEALHVYHQYTIRVADGGRDDLAGALARAGIASAVYYRTPVHQLEIYASDAPSLPVAEAASREALSLPIGPMLDPASIDRVVAAVRSWSEARA